MNFVICGLPRSGTTIIARFAESLPNCAVLHEPIQASKKHGGDPAYWEDFFFKVLDPQAKHLFIKEPFHIHPEMAQTVNVKILERLRVTGWNFIYVTRSPKGTFGSWKKWEAYNNVNKFSESYRSYGAFYNPSKCLTCQWPFIAYESFCHGPSEAWNMVTNVPKADPNVMLKPCTAPAFMGCWKAMKSATILDSVDHESEFTNEELEVLDKL